MRAIRSVAKPRLELHSVWAPGGSTKRYLPCAARQMRYLLAGYDISSIGWFSHRLTVTVWTGPEVAIIPKAPHPSWSVVT